MAVAAFDRIVRKPVRMRPLKLRARSGMTSGATRIHRRHLARNQVLGRLMNRMTGNTGNLALRVAAWNPAAGPRLIFVTAQARSEERRVGKECRSRWSP